MKNYLYINGEKVELTAEQIKKMAELGIYEQPKTTVCESGKTVMIGKYEFIILDKDEENGTMALLMKDLLKKDFTFGNDCDFKKSNVKKVLDDFAEQISAIIGDENLVEHYVDLTSDDGLKDYGGINAKMSLLTCDLYRMYVERIDEYKLDSWWWLATSFSTEKHGYTSLVKCVSPCGYLNIYNCNFSNYGVRPFCIVKSSIFQS